MMKSMQSSHSTGICQKIDLPIVGISRRECQERSLVIDIDKDTKALSYQVPKQFLAVKMPLKTEMKGFEDPIPDVQAGFLNCIDEELERLAAMDNVFEFDKGLIIFGKEDRFGLRYKYATVVFTDFDFKISDDKSLRKNIEKKVEEMFSYTSQRNGDLEFKDISLGSVYFGNSSENKDSFGISYMEYFYLNPKYFRKSAKLKGRYGVLSVLEPNLFSQIFKNLENL